jgi:2-hydroxychromene-2-carboxylate isomerase
MNNLSFYFSFRSPYAWLAFYRLSWIKDRLPVSIEYLPLFPPQRFPGDPVATPQKMAYVVEDIGRFARPYGLPLHWPEPFDTDWKRPHASFLYALDAGCAVEFGLAAFAARISRGQDLGENDTLAAIAEQCSLGPDSVLRSADQNALQRRGLKGVVRGQREGLFGVPFFVYQGRHYWGNDRLEWLLRDIATDSDLEVPDLKCNVFSGLLSFDGDAASD